MSRITIEFASDGTKLEADEGTLLSKVCEDAGFPQDLVCGGNGKCGKCAVEIVEDNVSRTVLSCHYTVSQDIIVNKIHNLANRKVNVLTSNSDLDCAINPQLRVLTVAVADIAGEHCGSYAEEIQEKFRLGITYSSLCKLSRKALTFSKDKQISLIIHNDMIIDVLETADPEIFGMAIDIGSTTIAGYIYNMENAELAGIYSSLNAQTGLGADVISRIGYCVSNEDGNKIMKEKVDETINYLLESAQKDGIDINSIYHVVLCGNSTMQHLFLNFYPENLGFAPFLSATHDFVEISGEEAGLNVNKDAIVTFLPLLGGFVGADTTAVLLGIPDDSSPRLVIDLGTNGEIAVGADDTYIIASTACGPALEGAGLSCGMRAAEGSIEHYRILPDKTSETEVIGNCAPAGICGSGIIDILAELIRANVITERGKMLSEAEYVSKYGEDDLSGRLRKLDDKNIFVLAEKEETASGELLYFSQMDARQIQLAKAAIATGCAMVVANYGIDPHDLKEICLAGAFGNYLDVENAQYIGLFPKYEGVPVRSIGNGAGTGVQMYLLDQSAVSKCRKIRKNAQHTELNFQEDFKETYFDQMLFRK